MKSEMGRSLEEPEYDIAQRVAKLKWQWAGHIVRRRNVDPNILGPPKVLVRQPRTDKRSAGRPRRRGRTTLIDQ
ncbi:jg8886 [Pararge aegeria aegeria]|uniref:Jg8886 protein n=1 Tax=Pararge aegeria aegeria TaxID=348720 RepID=A0A8S4R682_9NEOP|nr:jg8886 [Pararge aegeria aegeria]